MKKSLLLLFLVLAGCATAVPPIPVDQASVAPGSHVTRGGKTELALLGTPLEIGKPFPAVVLVDTNLKRFDTASLRGQVSLVSIVPSLDTKVCERQTHELGELKMPADIRRVTISRDLPFAQKRFADESGLKHILYLSDFQQGSFGRASGLLVDQIYLLARAVAVVDRDGIVRYLQVVPELSHLPDLPAAAQQALAIDAQ